MINSNRIFQFNDGEYVYAENNGIVFGSGPYQKYERGMYTEDVYDSSITFIADSSVNDNEAASSPQEEAPTMYITTIGRFYEPILYPKTGAVIGSRYQNPIFDSSSNDAKRIGTEQGFDFNFPSAMNTRRDLLQGNRQLYLLDGTITIYNDIVVGATGIYKKYVRKVIHATEETTKSDGGTGEETSSFVLQFNEPPVD